MKSNNPIESAKIGQFLKQCVEHDIKSASPMAHYDYLWDPKRDVVMSIKLYDKESPIAEIMLKTNLSLSHTAQMVGGHLMVLDNSLMLDGIHDPWAWTGVDKPPLEDLMATTPRKDRPKESIDRPERYLGKKGDLLDAFEGYILNHDEMVGAYKFNIIKYVTRFVEKNGIEDLDKADVYIKRLKKFLKEEEA